MKNLSNILSKGSFKERTLLYFENLGIESIKEGTGEAGFLSELEESNFLNSFYKNEEHRHFDKCNRYYKRITETLNKVYILKLQFEISVESYHWIRLLHLTTNYVLDGINQYHYENGVIDKFKKEFKKDVLLGTLTVKEGFFEVESDPILDFEKYLPLIKQATLVKLIYVKSAIHAVRVYMKEHDFSLQTHQNLLNLVEEATISLCANLNTDYSTVQIEEDYSNWFRQYFLE